jgi:hypothetical protein
VDKFGGYIVHSSQFIVDWNYVHYEIFPPQSGGKINCELCTMNYELPRFAGVYTSCTIGKIMGLRLVVRQI